MYQLKVNILLLCCTCTQPKPKPNFSKSQKAEISENLTYETWTQLKKGIECIRVELQYSVWLRETSQPSDIVEVLFSDFTNFQIFEIWGTFLEITKMWPHRKTLQFVKHKSGLKHHLLIYSCYFVFHGVLFLYDINML